MENISSKSVLPSPKSESFVNDALCLRPDAHAQTHSDELNSRKTARTCLNIVILASFTECERIENKVLTPAFGSGEAKLLVLYANFQRPYEYENFLLEHVVSSLLTYG